LPNLSSAFALELVDTFLYQLRIVRMYSAVCLICSGISNACTLYGHAIPKHVANFFMLYSAFPIVVMLSCVLNCLHSKKLDT